MLSGLMTLIFTQLLVKIAVEGPIAATNSGKQTIFALCLLCVVLQSVIVVIVYRICQRLSAAHSAREEATQRERSFHRLADNMPAHIARLDRDLRFLYLNPSYQKAVNVPAERLIGKLITDFQRIDPQFPAWDNALRSALQTGQAFQTEIAYATPVQRWLDVHVVPEMGDDGTLETLLLIVTDITERRRGEVFYRTMAANFPNGTVGLFDKDLRFLVVDGKDFAKYGRRPEDYVGKSLWELFPPAITDIAAPHYQAALQGESRYYEVEHGAGATYAAWVLPALNQDGVPIAGMVMTQDLTDQRRAEQDRLQLAIEREKRLLLDEFLRDVSHDLRTPLTTLMATTYVISELISRLLADPGTPPSPKVLENLLERTNALSRSASRLNYLIAAMLEILRLDQLPEYDFGWHALNDLVCDVVETIRERAEGKQIQLDYLPDTALPKLRLDSSEFSRVIQNLIENAIQYTPNGGKITVQTALRPEGVVFAVIDTGIGISEADKVLIFRRFYRTDRARGINSGGGGLGLAIVKKIVEAHKGRIEVESAEGEGSTFRVVLPLVQEAVTGA